MITTMKDFNETVDMVQNLIEKQRQIALAIRPEDKKWQESLDSQIAKLHSNEFRVLVMGVFSAGKSSFLNAVMGQKVLPTKILPTTSVITEIRYGQEKKIVVYPKPGCWDGGDEPFEVAPEELGKYCTIDNKKGINRRESNEAGRELLESPFKKIEVFSPIAILKDGVVLIDSPGMDDPNSRDDIVHDYIPSASAIIYLMHAKGQSGVDVRELSMLNSIGFKQFIICVTHFDEAVESFSSNEEREEYMDVIRMQNNAYTDLGQDGIFFLSSLDGLKAKLTGDHDLLVESGYKGMETYLESYLVENRAISQLDSAIGKLQNLNQEMTSAAETNIIDADKDTETLQLRIEIAEAELDKVRTRKDQILKDFKNEISPIREYVRSEAEKFVPTMTKSLSMEGFDPVTKIPTGIERLDPRKIRAASKSLAEEATVFLRQECEARMSVWYRNELMPGVYSIIQKAAKTLDKSFQNYQQELNHIDETLRGIEVKRETGDSVFGGAVWGLLFTLATQSWVVGLLGPIYGAGTMGRVAVAQAATGVVLGIVSCFFPVTWGALIVAALVAAFLALITGGESQVRQIKKEAIKSVRKTYEKSDTRDKVVNDVVNQTMNLVGDFTKSLEKAFAEDIDIAVGKIEDKKQTALLSASERAGKKEEMVQCLEQINQLKTEIAGVVGQYKHV